jgi:hypothetical protein
MEGSAQSLGGWSYATESWVIAMCCAEFAAAQGNESGSCPVYSRDTAAAVGVCCRLDK